ncbi:MAG TPA: PEP-CTERM sorting domain-containing protein [Fimbriimonadaceae bacterium]|nr:PEP-CTERM sorting domain-containing protein [Fimbriimonadaceae bacterium]
MTLCRRFITSALLVAACPVVFAQALGPGEGRRTNGELFDMSNWTLVDTRTQNISGENAAGETRFTGMFTNSVYRNQQGQLTFTYQFTNSANSQDSVKRMATTGFTNFVVSNTNFALNSTGTRGSTSVFRDENGSTLSYNFDPTGAGGNGVIGRGETTRVIFITTNATQYTNRGTTQFIDGGVDSVNSFAPVPEPSTIAALGLGGLALLRRRKKS